MGQPDYANAPSNNGQCRSGDAPTREGQSERRPGASVVPSTLYEVDENGIHRTSKELEAIRGCEPDAITLPIEQIRPFASCKDAEDRTKSLAKSVARQPRAGVMAAIDYEESYLASKANNIQAEKSRLEAECLAMPYDIMVRDAAARDSMTDLELWGYSLAMACLMTMGLWTAGADVTMVYDNLSIVFPVESDEVDFSALYAADLEMGNADQAAEPSTKPLYSDPNFYKSIAVFSVLFVLAAMLDVLKVLPLVRLQPLPRGSRRKLRWLFSPQGLIALVQVGLLLAAIAFNLRIGFELDRTAMDIDAEPPISSSTTYSLMAVALAFSAYAFVHWAIDLFRHLCGIRLDRNPVRVAMEERVKAIGLVLDSIVDVLSCFKGLRGGQEAFETCFVEECLSVLAGIQEEQRTASQFAEAAAQQAAAAARMQALKPSAN